MMVRYIHKYDDDDDHMPQAIDNNVIVYCKIISKNIDLLHLNVLQFSTKYGYSMRIFFFSLLDLIVCIDFHFKLHYGITYFKLKWRLSYAIGSGSKNNRNY